MHASYLTAFEQWRFTKPVDLAQYMCEQSSRLNRAIVGKVQGVDIVVQPNDNLDDVRAQISQKLVGRGHNPQFTA